MHRKIIAFSVTTAIVFSLFTIGVYAAPSNDNLKSGKPGFESRNKGSGGGQRGGNMNGVSIQSILRISADDFSKLVSESTVLTDDERTQLTTAYTEIISLYEQLTAIKEDYKTADDTTKETLKTQYKDLNSQIKEKISSVKDLLSKLQTANVASDISGDSSTSGSSKTDGRVRGPMGGMDLKSIISNSTTLTDDEKAQLTTVNDEINALKEQMETLREEEKNADDITKATLKTQTEDLMEQIQEKLESVKDILSEVMPEMQDSYSTSDETEDVNKGPMGRRGQKGGMDLDNIINNSTTLTDDEKAQLTTVNDQIKALKEQIQTLIKEEKDADDTTKATLKTQIEDLMKQIQEKLESVKDILSEIMTTNSDSLEDSSELTGI